MDKIEALKQIHYRCKEFLDIQDYHGLDKYMRTFIHDDVDINELKTIMIITKGFKNNPIISLTRVEIVNLFDIKYAKLISEK